MKPCEIIESKKPFSFTCDSAVLAKAISKVVTVADFSKGSEDRSVCLIASYKNNLFVIGYSTETFSAFHVEGVEASVDGSFAFEPKTLLGLIKGRSELAFTYENGRLNFSAVKGKYAANLVTSATPPEAMVLANSRLRVEKKKSTTLDSTMLDSLRSAMAACNLQDIYGAGAINSYIHVNKGILEVSAYDNSHMAYYKSKVSNAVEFKMALPILMFNLIDRFVSDAKEDVDFVVSGKHLLVFGRTYLLSLPPVQAEDNNYKIAVGYLKGLKSPVGTLSFKEAGIKTVDNMFTIADENSRLILTVSGKGKAIISLNNESGSISDEFKTDAEVNNKAGKIVAMIDPRVFADLFRKCSGDEIPMNLYKSGDKSKASSFVITQTTKTSKAYWIGTYSEE